MRLLFHRALLATLVISAPALANKTQFFKHADRASFETGTLENVVATNFGELRLARAVESVMKDEGKYASVDAIAETPDGTIYFGTSASGKLLSLKDGKTAELADFGEAASISALVTTAGGDVIVGVSGERAEIQVLRKGEAKPARLAQLPDDVQYVWSIALAADGKIYVGTGPSGQLFEMAADGSGTRVIFDSDEDNLRALAILNDAIFVGTDPDGLILKIDRATGKAFVIYDAPETEVSSLLVDTRGGQIYAATSQLVEAPAEAEPASVDGRPSGGGAERPMTFEPADAPKPGGDHGAGEGTLRATPTEPAVANDAAEAPTTQPAAETPPRRPRDQKPRLKQMKPAIPALTAKPRPMAMPSIASSLKALSAKSSATPR